MNTRGLKGSQIFVTSIVSPPEVFIAVGPAGTFEMHVWRERSIFPEGYLSLEIVNRLGARQMRFSG